MILLRGKCFLGKILFELDLVIGGSFWNGVGSNGIQIYGVFRFISRYFCRRILGFGWISGFLFLFFVLWIFRRGRRVVFFIEVSLGGISFRGFFLFLVVWWLVFFVFIKYKFSGFLWFSFWFFGQGFGFFLLLRFFQVCFGCFQVYQVLDILLQFRVLVFFWMRVSNVRCFTVGFLVRFSVLVQVRVVVWVVVVKFKENFFFIFADFLGCLFLGFFFWGGVSVFRCEVFF